MEVTTVRNISENISRVFFHIADGCCRRPFGIISGSVITILIAIISIIGNLLVVVVSFNDESLRMQTGNLLLVYQSIVGILRGLFVMTPSAISVAYDYWPLGSKMCKLQAFFNYMFACSSSIILAVIGMERVIALIYRIRYRTVMTTKVMIKACAFVFIVSCIVASSCALPDWTNFNYSEAACAMDYKMGYGVYHVYNLSCFTCYYMPIGILILSYTIIIITDRDPDEEPRVFYIRRHTNTFYRACLESEDHIRKTIKSAIAVVLTYYVCLAPYALIKEAEIILGIYVPPELYYFSNVFIYIPSAANPFIYAIFRKDYRQAFKGLLKCGA